MGESDRGLQIKASPLQHGYNSIVGPGEYDLKLLELGRIVLGQGDELTRETGECEVCLDILSGRCSVTLEPSGTDGRIDSATYENIGGRSGVFDGNPTMVYVPRNVRLTITATSAELDIAMFSTPARRDTAPILVEGSSLERQSFGTGNHRREACIALGNDQDVDRLLVGETYNLPGCWSSYPPHKHDTAKPPTEEPYEEIYFYLTDPPQGFGIQRVYTDPDATDPFDEVYVVESGDAVAIPRGYHPVVAGAGYHLCYLWALAGEKRRFGQWSDDPKHAWIRKMESGERLK